jgi:hypothetical protein
VAAVHEIVPGLAEQVIASTAGAGLAGGAIVTETVLLGILEPLETPITWIAYVPGATLVAVHEARLLQGAKGLPFENQVPLVNDPFNIVLQEMVVPEVEHASAIVG